MSESTPPVLFDVQGPVAFITLNRPQAINSLNLEMIRLIAGFLDTVEKHAELKAVVLAGAGARGFASGADVKWLRQCVLDGNVEEADRFFEEEYALDLRIHRFEKPIFAVMDGITMGGGLGLVMGARYRIVTQRTRIAMPETLIGFFPDVGASWFLNRLPGAWGPYLALTANEVSGALAKPLGFATHRLDTTRLEELPTAIARGCASGDFSFLDDWAATLTAVKLEHAAWIDRHFGLATVAEVRSTLAATAAGEPDDPETRWAAENLAKVNAGSPHGVSLTWKLLREQPPASLDAAFAGEYEAARVAIRHPDYAEGIRARLVDKDFTPKWSGAN